MKRVAIYTRVSTQKNSQESSMVSQKDHYIDYCNREGFELIELYAEKGVTGTNARKRPEFIRMMHDAGLDFVINNQGKDFFNLSTRVPKFDYIVCKDPSRFSRSAAIGLEVIEQLRNKKVYVIFENSGFSSESSSWHFNMSMLFTVAQTESYNMSRRIKFSKKHMANNGKYAPARTAFGYVRNEDNEIVIDPSQAEVVRYIFNRYLEVGSSIITKELNEKGVKSQTGARFSPDKISRIIGNTIYYGEATINKTNKENITDVKREKNDKAEYIVIPNAVEPIVSEDLWKAANKIREERVNKNSKRGRKVAVNDIYYNKLFCENCGSRMVRHIGVKDKITYICQSRRKNGECSARSIAITLLNRFMRQIEPSYMTNAMGDSIYYKGLWNKLEEQKSQLSESQQIIQQEIEEAKVEAKNYAKQYATLQKGAMRETLMELAEEKQTEIANLQKKLDQLNIVAIERIQQKVAEKKNMIETIFKKKNFTPEEKLNLLNKVDVSDNQLTFYFSMPTFEEEVNDYNELFPLNPIDTNISYNPFNTETIRRDHKAAREFWEMVDEDSRSSEL